MKRVVSFLLALTLASTLSIIECNAFDFSGQGVVNCGSDKISVIQADGSLWAWGDNSYGYIDPEIEELFVGPTRIIDNINEVSGTMALTRDGVLWDLGNVDTYYMAPVGKKHIKVMDDVKSIGDHALIKKDGSLWTWGSNAFGQLGNGTKSHEGSLSPVRVMSNVAAVSCGGGHMAAIKDDGSLWTWGFNFFGQLGNGTNEDSSSPLKVMDNVVAVSCGGSQMAAIKKDGSLWTWGCNLYGELGNGATEHSAKPIKIMDSVTAVSCGNAHMAALKKDGSLWMWGENTHGELGNGSNENSSIPIKTTDNVVAVSCGYEITAAVKKDGSLWIWGSNRCGLMIGGVNAPSKFDEYLYCQNVPKRIDGISVLLPGAEPSRPTVAGFNDVYESDYYADAVNWAVNKAITTGTGNASFSPNTTLTRAQAVTFLWRAKGKPSPLNSISPFVDVNADDYYHDAVLWAVEQGITNGVGDGKFGPNLSVTRGQMIVFLWRVEGMSNDTGGVWYEAAENWAKANQLLEGTSEAYETDKDCPRADVIYYLFKYMTNG